MKQLLFLLLIFTMLIGCMIPEEVPEPSPIVCEGGHYRVYFREWQLCGCPSCETYEAGTYWLNKNGKRFLLGEPVSNPIEIYGDCPAVYIQEIKLEG